MIPGINTTPRTTGTQAVAATGESGFAAFLQQALGQTAATDYADKTTALSAVLGQSDDIHGAVIAAEKAEIALNLTLQIRNKLVESYQEIMRMQI
jgi:flagellar hook-basal body complex protein FliE